MAKQPFTMHPHGVSYDKSSEGAVYSDNTKNDMKADDIVLPGDTHLYTWKINPENAPAKGDQACVASVYHSHIMVPKDINTGLIGMNSSFVLQFLHFTFVTLSRKKVVI